MRRDCQNLSSQLALMCFDLDMGMKSTVSVFSW